MTCQELKDLFVGSRGRSISEWTRAERLAAVDHLKGCPPCLARLDEKAATASPAIMLAGVLSAARIYLADTMAADPEANVK